MNELKTLFSQIYSKLGYSPGSFSHDRVDFVKRANLRTADDERKIRELNDGDLIAVRRVLVCRDVSFGFDEDGHPVSVAK